MGALPRTSVTSLSRDNRDVTAFCAEFARRNQLNAEDARDLAERTESVVAWVRRFRRTVGFASRYPEGHAQRTAVLGDLDGDTRDHVERWGTLELRLLPGRCETVEGFPIPAAAETDGAGYTLFPLHRDGVARLVLGPGAGTREIETLLRAIAATPAAEPVDAFLCLWRAQSPSLRVEASATITAEAAGALSSADPSDPAANAFVATLTAAAPFYTSGDLRPMFTTATLDGLVGHGIQPKESIRMLTTPEGAATVPSVDPEQAASLRLLFDHTGDRDARCGAIREAQFHTAGS